MPGGPPPSGGSGSGKGLVIVAVVVVLALLLLVGGVGLLLATRSSDDVTTTAPPATEAPPATASTGTKRTTTTKGSDIDPDRTTTTRRSTTTTKATTTTPPAATWTPWTAPDGRFTIDFPATPVVKAVPVTAEQIQSANQASADLGPVGYLVVWYDLAPGFFVSDPPAVLNAGVDAFALGANLTFTGRAIGDFAGNPALNFSGVVPGGLDFEGMAIISGPRIYLFGSASSPGAPRDFPHFISSFKIN